MASTDNTQNFHSYHATETLQSEKAPIKTFNKPANSIQTSNTPQINGPPRLSPVEISSNNILHEQAEHYLNEESEETNADEEQQTSELHDQITITITAQGHLKLTDSSQRTYFVNFLILDLNFGQF